MKRSKYVLILIIVIILIVIVIRILNPKAEKTVDKITPLSNLNQKDSIDNRGNNKNIYKIENIRAITSENYYTSPTFSPDGKKIAITNLNYKGLYVENIADGTQKKITDDDGAGFRYCWSPDSKEIVYLSRKVKDGVSDNSIKLVEIGTGKITELTAGGVGASIPSFSKTMGIIYSYKGILIMRKEIIEKNTQKKSYGLEDVVAENVPANIIIQSPTEDKLIIEDDEGIKIMKSTGENRKIIIKNGKNDFACDSKFSFDGSKVMFANNVGSIGHLFIYDIISENILDLGEGYFGQWTPDGQVVYCITTNDGNVIVSSEIYLISADGFGKVKITNTPNQIAIYPVVSPNGKSIAYRDDKSGIIYYGMLNKINQ